MFFYLVVIKTHDTHIVLNIQSLCIQVQFFYNDGFKLSCDSWIQVKPFLIKKIPPEIVNVSMLDEIFLNLKSYTRHHWSVRKATDIVVLKEILVMGSEFSCWGLAEEEGKTQTQRICDCKRERSPDP